MLLEKMAEAAVMDSSRDLFDDELRQMLENAETRLKTSVAQPPSTESAHSQAVQTIRMSTSLATAQSESTGQPASVKAQGLSPEIGTPRKPEPDAKARRQAQKVRSLGLLSVHTL